MSLRFAWVDYSAEKQKNSKKCSNFDIETFPIDLFSSKIFKGSEWTYSIASSLHSAASLHVSFFALWVCLNEHIGGTLKAGGPVATVPAWTGLFFLTESSSLIGSSWVATDSFIVEVDVVLVVDVVVVLVVVEVVVGSVVVVGVVLISYKWFDINRIFDIS